jgi:type IV pilus assembly protein PilE
MKRMDQYGRLRQDRLDGGFTLIELMITVVILAILSSIAIPTYQNYVRRGQLTEAFTTLSDVRVKMEQYYQDNKYYGSGPGATTCPTTLPGYSGFPAAQKYFSIVCDADGGTAPLQKYKLTAQGSGSLTTGYDYTLTHSGQKGTAKFQGSTVSGVSCWLTKAGSCDN